MNKRRKAREAALQGIYELDLSGRESKEVLTSTLERSEGAANSEEYVESLISGVACNLAEIDEIIEGASDNWSIERISAVDRAILRLGIFELVWGDDVPYKVVIDEAVELGKLFGSESSGSFVNGVLDRVVRESGHRITE